MRMPHRLPRSIGESRRVSSDPEAVDRWVNEGGRVTGDAAGASDRHVRLVDGGEKTAGRPQDRDTRYGADTTRM
jgi:hypothetical protein